MATRDQIAQLRVHRQIAELSGRRARKPKAKIPELRDPRGDTMAYLVALRRQLVELERATTDIVIAGLPRVVAQLPPELRLDGPADEALRQDVDRLKDAALPLFGEAAVVAIATEVAQSTAVRHRSEFGRQMVAAIGIDPFVADPNLAAQIDGFIADNVSLIKNLGDDQIARMEGIVQRGLRAGLRHEVIAKQIREAFGFARKRAAFIARDQVSKLYGELTRSRQQQVGINKYRWSTSRDERVRPGHRRLEGTIQEWSNPPITNPKTGGRAHPRQDPNCRCESVPFVDDLLEELGITGVPDIPRTPRPFPTAVPRRRQA